jgi:hypothetical protein
MITPFFELHHSPAVVAPLPALILGQLDETVRLLISRALSTSVESATAHNTYLGAASSATSILATGDAIHAYLGRFDPFPTPFVWTIHSIGGSIFLVFLIPQSLELVIEKAVGVL